MNLDNFNTEAIKDLYMMGHEDVSQYAECLTSAFEGYSLFEYFSNYNYDAKKMKAFWQTMLKASKNNSLSLSVNNESDSVIICFKPGYSGPGLVAYLKNGGLKIVRNFGLSSVSKMMKFEGFANSVKQKYADKDCWYIYSFVTKPDKQGQGYGSKLIKALLKFFDENKQNCYLETLKKENVEIYQHLNFDLVDVQNVPKTDLTIYAMYRAHNKTNTLNNETQKNIN